ncbi:MAG: hypothetical protein ACRDQ2_13840, partial [Gaiellales bacterium]
MSTVVTGHRFVEVERPIPIKRLVRLLRSETRPSQIPVKESRRDGIRHDRSDGGGPHPHLSSR